MSDEQFRLTPLDVRRWEFSTALRGYDRARVDEFKARVADEFEELTRKVADLDAKAHGFHDQIRSFRERDRAINDALVSAQQLRSDIREQAEKEGSLVLQEARAEAERLVTDARRTAEDLVRSARDDSERVLRDAKAEAKALVEDSRASAKRVATDLDQLQRSRLTYLSQMKALAERHLQEVEAVRTASATLPPVVSQYVDESEAAVETRIKPRRTPHMNTVVTPKETIIDTAKVRAVTEGASAGADASEGSAT